MCVFFLSQSLIIDVSRNLPATMNHVDLRLIGGCHRLDICNFNYTQHMSIHPVVPSVEVVILAAPHTV